MEDTFLKDLNLNEVDVEGTLERLSDDTEMYKLILASFPADVTMSQLETALQNKSWDDAFTAAHALKGLAGNLGFTSLFHALGQLVILIRAGKVKEVDESFQDVKKIGSITNFVG